MIKNLELSLKDLVGTEYIDKVCRAFAALTGQNVDDLLKIAEERVSFFPETLVEKLDELISVTGKDFSSPL